MDASSKDTSQPVKNTPSTKLASPELAAKLREYAVPALCDCLVDMLTRIDDVLFDFADRAHSNNEQTLYFDAMRTMRLAREPAEQVFQQSLDNQFKKLQTHEANLIVDEDFVTETIALVDDEAMELDIATKNIVHRARCELPVPLLQLCARLNSLLPEDLINEDNNPLDPQQIVIAFSQAIQDIDIELKIRLILYKEFERYLLSKLDQIIFGANQLLIDAGILPDISASLPRSSIQPQAAKSQTVATTQQQEPVQFDTLQSLLSNLQEQAGVANFIQQDPQQPAMQHDQLFEWFSMIQKQDFSNNSSSAQPKHLYVREEVFSLLRAQEESAQHLLHKVDDNVINLVDLMFEYIMDQDIPTPIAALIGRLQIPTLKVALLDKAFFNSEKHPARLLLNAIAQATLGWHTSNYEQDELYQKVAALVTDISHIEKPDVALFARHNEQFQHYVSEATQKAELLTERAANLESARLVQLENQKMVSQLINDRLQGKALPLAVIALIQEAWQPYLLTIQTQQGTDTPAWSQALQAVDELIWSVQPERVSKDHQRWVELVPQLLVRLRAGLKVIEYPTEKTNEFMSQLWEIHSKLMSSAHEDDIPRVKVDFTEEKQPQTSPSLEQQGLDANTIAQLRDQINNLQLQDWFEFQQLNGRKIRCRLVRKIRTSNAYIFTNRFGAQARALNKDQLALYFHQGKARRLESSPLIDRALHAIFSQLKSTLPQ